MHQGQLVVVVVDREELVRRLDEDVPARLEDADALVHHRLLELHAEQMLQHLPQHDEFERVVPERQPAGFLTDDSHQVASLTRKPLAARLGTDEFAVIHVGAHHEGGGIQVRQREKIAPVATAHLEHAAFSCHEPLRNGKQLLQRECVSFGTVVTAHDILEVSAKQGHA